jgi:outer membrane receptor for ferrienterochelin and colicins
MVCLSRDEHGVHLTKIVIGFFRMLRKILPILLIFFLIQSAFLFAQTGVSDDLSELSIEELMSIQVVSSTQQSVRFAEAPSSTFVVNGDQLRKWGIRRISELIERLVPGAITSEDVDDIILSFRGITADNNIRVLLLINGHEYNSQWNNGPSSEVELGLLDDIQKVEVLIGPHTAVYGSAAFLGVINMITKTGNDFSGVQVTGNYGSGDYKKGGLIVGGKTDEKLNYFFSAGGLAAEGLDNNDNFPLNISRFPPSWRFFGNVNYGSFEFMSRYTRSSRDFYIQQVSTTEPNVWTNYDTFFLSGRKTFNVRENLQNVLDLSYDSIETQRHDFTLGTKLRAVGEDRFSAKFTSFYSYSTMHHFVFGVYYRRDQFGDDWEGDNFNFLTKIENGRVTGVPADPFTKRVLTPFGRNVYALFGQDSIRFNDELSLLLGFRYDRVEAPKIPQPDNFSPRIAFVVTPNPKTVFKAMFTSGVALPLNAGVTSEDNFAFGNPNHIEADKSERLHSIELEASYQPTENSSIGVNVFYNSLQDIFGVFPIPNTDPMAFRLLNHGRVDYVGFEAIASANLNRQATVRVIHQHVQFGSVVDYIFDFLTTTDNQHLANYPEDVTKILGDLRINKTFTVNANANLVWNNFSRHTIIDTNETGFYALLNSNLVWEVNPRTEFIFSGYNLFNEQKRIPPMEKFAFLPERNFNVNFLYRF